MELTDPEQSPEIDSVAFALHSMHLAICTAAFAFNSLLLYLIRKCAVFHPHMKIIMINQTLAVMAAIVYLLLRSTLGLWQTYDGPAKEPVVIVDDSQCAFSSSVPDSLCMLFIWFPFLLLIERYYATRNFRNYENLETPVVFKVLCGVMWLPMVTEMLAFLFNHSLPSNLQACQYSLLQQSHMQRNVWFIIIAVFSVTFSVFFKLLEIQNKRIDQYSVEQDYAFGPRYQIRENVRTCRFAFSLLFLYFIFFFVFFVFDQNLETREEVRMNAAARREYLFLIFPIFALIYSLHFLTANNQLFETAKRTFQQYYHPEHGNKPSDKKLAAPSVCFRNRSAFRDETRSN
ncbi:unnamed protein product [Caenorhabditis sp. 36 PRJEB53466]|nr:unnamed protein product [Caenorhabditis sp. 36 PRJEB53466]